MEETELIRVTFQGTEMFLKLGGAAIKDALKFIKFLITAAPEYNRWKINRDTEKMKNELTRAEYELVKSRQKVQEGGMAYGDFIKAFGSEERTIINITDTSADRFHDLAKRHKLTYTLMPDLNIADGVFQIMVPASQADIYKVIIDRLTSEEFVADQKRVSEIEDEIGKLKKEVTKCENTLEQFEQEEKKDSDEYRLTEEKISELENEIMEKENDISRLKENTTGEITYEDYMATNQFAFDHQELFEAMMEEGIELHSDGLKESLLKIAKEPDKTEVLENTERGESVKLAGRKESIYLVNPNTVAVAVKIDKQEEGTCRCTVMKEGKDTNITYEINKNVSASDVLPFVKMIDKEIRKISDVLENEWVCVNSHTQYDRLISQMEINLPSSSQAAEKEIESKVPQAKEKLETEANRQAEEKKNIIQIPRENLLIMPQMNGVNFDYTLFSDNMKYTAELPYDRVHAGADDSLILVLEKDESIDFKERRTDVKAGSISDSKSLHSFISEKTGAMDGIKNDLSKLHDTKMKGGGLNAATV